MNAKFGKISIGCFVASFILPVSFIALILRVYPPDSSINLSGFFLSSWIVLLAIPFRLSGVICGIIGAIKKESPIFYYVFGLVLNSIFLLWTLVKIIYVNFRLSV